MQETTRESRLSIGTVTFLFSDIEGSTKMLHRLGDRYAEVLEAHRRLIRDAFRVHGGIEFGTEGDAFFVAFSSAKRALAAALDAQRALADHAWAPGEDVRVRMGVHSGEANLVAGDYVGMALHEAARITSA